MSMMQLAMQNFKSSFKNYLALILSLAFTILIFLNFQYLVYSDTLAILGERNKSYIDILIQVVSFVLCCFMFFFIWYSTNVFLMKRKKEIGIYVFMGLTNQKIGKLYMLEYGMIGLFAMVLGVGFGIISTQLFQMILLAISEVTVDIEFHFSLQPILITIGIYLAIYLIFLVKGYVSILQSSVLDMVSANRKNEYVRQKNRILIIKSVVGIGILATGYYFAIKDGGQEVMGNVLLAVVLVIVGVYLLFGGFIPFVFQRMEKNKGFLYQGQRTLWVNNLIFRMKKNYRTYAIVCVLMLCSVTALATGFAMKIRYDNIIHFRSTYTFQILSNQQNLDGKIRALIEKDSDIKYSSQTAILALDRSLFETRFKSREYALVSYSQIEKLAKEAHLEFDLKEPKDDEIIEVAHLYLMSLITDRTNISVMLNGKKYNQIAETSVSYLGYLQENMDYYMVNDHEYEKLLPLGKQLYTYNYKIKDAYGYKASLDELDAIVDNTKENYTARVAIDPNSSDIEWIKILYSICIFMFMVFVLASGSILFMKIYNDALEEKERYEVLRKLGISQKILKKAISSELRSSYALPFVVMAVSSYFSVHALEKMVHTSLVTINIVSIAIIFGLFLCCYFASVLVYQKNVGMGKEE